MSEAEDRNRPNLPAAVYDLAIRLGVKPQDNPSGVNLTQTGRMKRDLGSESWMAFTATQTIRTRTCEFDWRAKAGPFGVISGRDSLTGGEGRFEILALGLIPIALAPRTAALVRGELMRHLAEIAWAPHAILCNPGLRWRMDGPETLSVGAGTGETACEVRLSLDGEGRIAGAYAADRPRSAAEPTLPTPWRGRFADYRRFGDIWLPVAGEVAWEIDGKERLYWQCRIAAWKLSASHSHSIVPGGFDVTS
jgi:hypothetical protein